MARYILLLLLVSLALKVKSQNIFSALHLNDKNDYKTKAPKKIIEKNSFYSLNGETVVKSVKVFDSSGMLLTEERFNGDGDLTTRLTYVNDTIRRIKLSRTIENLGRFVHTISTAYYKYNPDKILSEIIDRNVNNGLIDSSIIVSDNKGNPIKLSLYDRNGTLMGNEIATYLYTQNKAVTSVIRNDGSVISTDTIKITYTDPGPDARGAEMYNSHGDLTKWTSKNIDGSKTDYEEEYEYDQYGNCTAEKIYKIITAEKSKKTIDRVFTKKYLY